jgi:L-fucose isomerase-like protein
VGKENTYGTVTGRLKAGDVTYCRVSTDDSFGDVRAYLGEARITDDKISSFGGYGVIEVPDFQGLLRYICENGFEHHVALSPSRVAGALEEAMENYLDWDVYHHIGS